MFASDGKEQGRSQVESTSTHTRPQYPQPDTIMVENQGRPDERQSSDRLLQPQLSPLQPSTTIEDFNQSAGLPSVWKPISVDLVRPGASGKHSNSFVNHEWKREVEDLRNSHAVLSRRVRQLAMSLQSSERSAIDSRTSVHHDDLVRDQFSLRRIRLFASIYVTKALKGPSAELRKNYTALNEANTVRQVLLRSKPTDCSLHEFRMLLSACTNDESISCRVFPSEYYALLLHPATASRFQILFESFKDLCEALQIDLQSREKSVYLEKKSAGRLKAVQILGVVKSFSESSSNSISRRWIFLGSSFFSSFSLRNCPALIQRRAVWSQADHCWETGLSLALSASPDSIQRLEVLAEAESSPSTSGVDSTDMNKLSKEMNVFALIWERMEDSAHTIDGSAISVCGTLRAYMPAVVLRSVNLTSTAQKAFNEKVHVFEQNSARNNQIYLKEFLVSSRHGISQSHLPHDGT